MSRSSTKIAQAAAVVLTTLVASTCAQAQFSYNGYFRAGPGSTSSGTARSCYGLNGAGLKYRLGNECDIYTEIDLSNKFETEGVSYTAHVMPNLWNPGTDNGSATFGLAQLFLEGKGYDIAPSATFWAGKRFYGRSDVHIVDTNFVKEDGVGGGFSGLPVGPGKLSVAYFRDDGAGGTKPASRYNIDLGDIAVNAGGKLRFATAFTKGDFSGGQSGTALTVQHNQDNALGLGGGNTLWLQMSKGSAGIDANFGDATAGSDVKSTRVVESLTWQVGAFGGQAIALIAKNKSNTVDNTLTSFGGRISYGLTRNFKLVSELGLSAIKPASGDKQTLTKITVAPTLSTGQGFWNRPELRLYVTHATWNDAAAAGGNGLIAGKTSNTSMGVQAEIWF